TGTDCVTCCASPAGNVGCDVNQPLPADSMPQPGLAASTDEPTPPATTEPVTARAASRRSLRKERTPSAVGRGLRIALAARSCAAGHALGAHAATADRLHLRLQCVEVRLEQRAFQRLLLDQRR